MLANPSLKDAALASRFIQDHHGCNAAGLREETEEENWRIASRRRRLWQPHRGESFVRV